MLQWMGGSRRKLTTSRKSAYNRQKQYFKQKQHQLQIRRLESLADERDKDFDQFVEPRSLDVLSLSNAALVTRKHFPVNQNKTGLSEAKACRCLHEFPSNGTVSASTDPLKKIREEESCRASEVFPDVSLKDTGGSYGHLKELKNFSCSENGNQNLNISAATASDIPGIVSGHNSYNSTHDGLDKNMPSSSDPVNTPKNGSEAEELKRISEKHISVFDLLCDDQSPSKPERLPSGEAHVAFSVRGLGEVRMETPVHSPRQVYCFPSPTSMSYGWMHSSQNLLDDAGDKPMKRNTDSMCFSASESYSKSCQQEYMNFSFSLDSGKMEAPREDIFGIFEEDLLDDRKYNISCDKKPFCVDFNVPKFSEIRTSFIHDYGSEDSLFQNRCHVADRSLNFTEKQSWSYSVADDTTDICSEESCSSAAVRKQQTSNSGTILSNLRQTRKGKKGKLEKKCDITSGNNFVCKDIDEILRRKVAVGKEHNWTMQTNQMTVKKKAEWNSPSKANHASVNTNSDPNRYQFSSGTYILHDSHEFDSDECTLNLFKVPNISLDIDASQRRKSTVNNSINHEIYGRSNLMKKESRDNQYAGPQDSQIPGHVSKMRNKMYAQESQFSSGNARMPVVTGSRDPHTDVEKSESFVVLPAAKNAPTAVRCFNKLERESREPAFANVESMEDCEVDASSLDA